MIFILPAFGILLFTSMLLYEKINIVDKIKNIRQTLDYIMTVEKLMDSIQKERSITSVYLSSKKFKYNLHNQRLQTDKHVLNIKQFYKKSTLIKASHDISLELDQFYTLRNSIDRFAIKPYESLSHFIYINKLLLDSTLAIKQDEQTYLFLRPYLYLSNLLTIKEYAEIEITLMAMDSNDSIVRQKIHNDLIESHSVQKANLNAFFIRAGEKDIERYNEIIEKPFSSQLAFIREEFKIVDLEDVIYVKNWWEIFKHRTRNLDKMFQFSITKANSLVQKYHDKSQLQLNLSAFFLFLSVLIISGLLYLIRKISLEEQKSFNKVDTEHEVYKLLNKTNKILLKIKDEKILFNGLCYMISKNKNMSFALICKNNKKIYANSSPLKDYVRTKINTPIIYNESLIFKVFNSSKNIIIDNFTNTQASILASVARKYHLKSAAAFPLKKFGKVYAVLIIYSNKVSFFNKEIEVLFENMINDVSHTLEKIAYENIRKIQEDELRIASYAFETNEPMLITDKHSKIIKANQAFCQTMGYELKELINKTPNLFKSNYHDSDYFKSIWNDLERQGSWSGELYNFNKNKDLLALRSTITAIKNGKGEVTHYLAQYLDIRKEKEKEKALEFIASHDNLTKLPNRFLLLDRLHQAILKVNRNKNYGAVLFVDLDNFKKTNDTMGHETGDKLLVLISKKLKESLRQEDTVARIGGDEFIVLAQNIAVNEEYAKEHALALANKINQALNQIKKIDEYTNIVTPSIGITLFNDNSFNAKDLIKQADQAMYKAKSLGKNTSAFFEAFS